MKHRPGELARLDALISEKSVIGSRCNEQGKREVGTEVFDA